VLFSYRAIFNLYNFSGLGLRVVWKLFKKVIEKYQVR